MAAKDFDAVVRLTPLVAIDLIVRARDGRILLGRRNYEPAKAYFFVPGGRITKNETLAAAFRRISRAELGVEGRIEEARFLGVYEHFYLTNNREQPGFGTHYVTLAYVLPAPACVAEACPCASRAPASAGIAQSVGTPTSARRRPVPDDSLPKDQHAEYLWLTEKELLGRAEVHDNTKAYFAR